MALFECVPGKPGTQVQGKVEVLLPVRRQAGFSLIELVVALLVAVILLAVSMPIFLRAYHSYQLTNATRQMADILRLTRYEAIRLNKSVNCVIQQSSTYPGMTVVWADSNNNNAVDPTEKMILLGNSGNLISSGSVPGAPTMLAQSGIGTMPTNLPSPTGSAVAFDQRGAVNPPTNVNVFYLASASSPDAGYRAVLLMPAGSIQIWIGDSSGNWQEQR